MDAYGAKHDFLVTITPVIIAIFFGELTVKEYS